MPEVLSPVTPLGPPSLASLSSFVGREREIAAVGDQLTTARLVTLTGAGGSGKTRLASEVLRSIAGRFRDGAVWIELAAITEPAVVLSHLAASLGVGGAGRPPADALRDALRDSERLLVLDNCEQVIDACAAAVELILHHCPGIRVLATSREALGIPGERAWLVPLLSLPDEHASLDAMASTESVRLFVERARAANGQFVLTEANADAVAQLCRRLDGLPLAIELAAARARALTPAQMVSRLDTVLRLLDGERRGATARHRTLRGAIDWSWDLLEPNEQILLRRLSVFAGELGLDAAEVVCGGDAIDGAEVLDLLAALVDKSLVVVQERADEARYVLLETIRQYGRERLVASAEAPRVEARHATWYASLIRDAEPQLITASRPIWVARISRELDDIRHALAWTREHDHVTFVELVGRLGWFWYSSGLWTEGRRWVEDALAMDEAREATDRRARALFAAGVIASLQGDGATARGWLEEAGAIARTLGDRALAAYADSYIGVALGQEGLPAAEAPTRAALAWFEQSGDLYGQRLGLIVLATLFVRQGDLDAARAAAGEGVRVARAYGLGRELGIALQVLGTVQLHQRQLDASAATIADALRALRDDPQPFWLARATELMGVVECTRGHALQGARLFGAAERRRERMGATLFRLDRERLAPVIAAARAAAGEAAFNDAWAAGRNEPFERSVDDAIEAANHGGSDARVDRHERSDVTTVTEPVLRVRLLGRLEVTRDGTALGDDVWKYARPRELFAYLLVHPDGCTREEVSRALWPDASVAQGKNNLHVTLHHLRRALGRADLILFERDRYVVNWSLGVEVDVHRFEEDVREARKALGVRATATKAARRLRAVLDRFRGEFLDDEHVGDWHVAVRDRVRQLRVDALAALGAHLVATGAHADAVSVYRELVQVDEWDEAAHRQLMLALARSGQRGDALRHYDRLEARLASELGTEPSRETVELRDRLRRGDRPD